MSRPGPSAILTGAKLLGGAEETLSPEERAPRTAAA
jgi:hypothetical protein